MAKRPRIRRRVNERRVVLPMNPLQLRPSQFITTYGVGALVDGRQGSSIILEFEKSELFPSTKPDLGTDEFICYVVALPGASRLSKVLENKNAERKEIGLFRMITNSDLNVEDRFEIYKTLRFPEYSLCNKHGNTQIIYHRHYPRDFEKGIFGICPKCLADPERNTQNYQSDQEVIRFIQICKNGHLNDVDWNYEVHRKKIQGTTDRPCKFTHLEWIEEGSELQYVKIKCPHCHESINLKQLKNRKIRCRRGMPWKGKETTIQGRSRISEDHFPCDEYVQIIQRNASNVFISQLITSISLPKEANAFYRTLNYKIIINEMYNNLIIDFSTLFHFYETHQAEETIKQNPGFGDSFEILKKIRTMGAQEISKAEDIISYFINDVLKASGTFDEMDLRREEFRAFKTGESESSLKIDPNLVIEDPIEVDYQWMGTIPITFRVTPIPKLEAILVQKGFQRIARPPKSKEERHETDISHATTRRTPYIDVNGHHWYLSEKLQGEGIFITLKNPKILGFSDENSKKWKYMEELVNLFPQYYKTEGEENGGGSEDDKAPLNNKLTSDDSGEVSKESIEDAAYAYSFFGRNFEAFANPLGTWWHTLAHRLILALSLDCGYSSAALRERLYIDGEEGGVLIFATQAGEDGTLGGLISQAQEYRFKEILELALSNINNCSNDPNCLESNIDDNLFGARAPNGAACYACLFLSETSCEFGNIGLDRKLLINNPS